MPTVKLKNIKIPLSDAANPKWHSLAEAQIQVQVVKHARDLMREFIPEGFKVPLIANPQNSDSKITFKNPIHAKNYRLRQEAQGFTKSQQDLIIPLSEAHKWPMLALEIKRHDKTPFKRNGQIRASKDDHLLDQAKRVAICQRLGWQSYFTVGLWESLSCLYNVIGNVEPPTELLKIENKPKHKTKRNSSAESRYLGGMVVEGLNGNKLVAEKKYFDLKRLNY